MPEPTTSDSKESTEKVDQNGTSETAVCTTEPENKSPEKSEAEVLYAQGKRHLFIKDYSNAVAVLGDACAKMVEQYGELADECAEVYFSYGRALLELAREESNILGTEPEKEQSEEEGDEEDEDNSAEDGSETKAASEGKESKEDNENSKNEAKEEENPADETIDTTKETNAEENQETEEEPDNLQLAWEVFELAKTIFERQNADAKLAETFLYLGEVALESENYNNAIEDMNHCVEIQKKILPSDHRDIAETYFQMGVACSLCNEFDNSIAHFKTSCEILESRVKNLQEKGVPDDKQNTAFYSVEKEIEEIKTLLPEIKVKIADMEDFKQETIKGLMSSLKGQPQISNEAGPSSSSGSSSIANGPSSSSVSSSIANGTTPKPATNISHLVRKKRKPDEEVSCDIVKKSCTNEVKK